MMVCTCAGGTSRLEAPKKREECPRRGGTAGLSAWMSKTHGWVMRSQQCTLLVFRCSLSCCQPKSIFTTHHIITTDQWRSRTFAVTQAGLTKKQESSDDTLVKGKGQTSQLELTCLKLKQTPVFHSAVMSTVRPCKLSVLKMLAANFVCCRILQMSSFADWDSSQNKKCEMFSTTEIPPQKSGSCWDPICPNLLRVCWRLLAGSPVVWEEDEKAAAFRSPRWGIHKHGSPDSRKACVTGCVERVNLLLPVVSPLSCCYGLRPSRRQHFWFLGLTPQASTSTWTWVEEPVWLWPLSGFHLWQQAVKERRRVWYFHHSTSRSRTASLVLCSPVRHPGSRRQTAALCGHWWRLASLSSLTWGLRSWKYHKSRECTFVFR